MSDNTVKGWVQDPHGTYHYGLFPRPKGKRLSEIQVQTGCARICDLSTITFDLGYTKDSPKCTECVVP